MFKYLNIFRSHGRQYVPDLTKAELTPLFRGRPVIENGITEEEAVKVISVCPVNAISSGPLRINLGKCIFCNECHFLLPEKIRFTNDYKIATNDPERLIFSEGEDSPIVVDSAKIRKEIKGFFRSALKLRQVCAGGDGSAEMELNAAGNVNFDMGRFGIEFVASPRHADGIVITGPITANMAEALQITYDAIPSPKVIILAGSDAISGGIFSESPELNRKFLQDHPVDLYIPGNPPHPLTFINGLLGLVR